MEWRGKFHLEYSRRARSRAAAVEESFEWAAAAKVKIEPAEDIVKIDAAEQVLLAEAFHAGKSAGIVFGALFRVG